MVGTISQWPLPKLYQRRRPAMYRRRAQDTTLYLFHRLHLWKKKKATYYSKDHWKMGTTSTSTFAYRSEHATVSKFWVKATGKTKLSGTFQTPILVMVQQMLVMKGCKRHTPRALLLQSVASRFLTRMEFSIVLSRVKSILRLLLVPPPTNHREHHCRPSRHLILLLLSHRILWPQSLNFFLRLCLRF